MASVGGDVAVNDWDDFAVRIESQGIQQNVSALSGTPISDPQTGLVSGEI
jgi:hypothetical protein